MIRQDIASTESVIENLNARIKDMLSCYENVLENLKAIPDLSNKTVEDLVAEIGLEQKRKTYLKKELELIGYNVQLVKTAAS
jgi:hypothetical protein